MAFKESKLKAVIESATTSLEDLGLEGLSEMEKPSKLPTGIARLDDLLSRGERANLSHFLASPPSSAEARLLFEAVRRAKAGAEPPDGITPKPGS